MAYNHHTSLMAILLISNILFAMTGRALAGRGIPTNSANFDDDKKQPEWFIGSDGSVIIPGIGRVLVPTLGPKFGNIGGGSTGTDIPGGDGTLVPIPGVEIPSPAPQASSPSAF